jgi:hypothetical protein
MELIEVETSFGVVAAGEQAIVDVLRELLRAEQELAESEQADPLTA